MFNKNSAANSRYRLTNVAAEQLAADYGCRAEDFFRRTNKVVLSQLNFGRRNFRNEPDFFKIATFGESVVAAVAPEMVDYAEQLLSCGNALRIFDGKGVAEINKELSKYGRTIGIFSQYYLPKMPYNYIHRYAFPLRVSEGEDISELYKYTEFQNALLYNCTGRRRDVLAVSAINGSTVMGVAGASNDSERFWQIGVDVAEPYRGRGVAAACVSMLASEIFMRGAIPYYGTWMGNIASQNVAISCGFYPAWTEIVATPI